MQDLFHRLAQGLRLIRGPRRRSADPGTARLDSALQNMRLSRGDEIAVTMLCRRIKTPKYALVCQPFAPLSSLSLCCSMFSAFIFPVCVSLCAQASNELVWFPRPATGRFPPPPPPPTTNASCACCFLLSELHLPEDFPGWGFFPSLPPSAFVFPWRRRIQHPALPRPAGVRTPRSADAVLPRCEKCISASVIAPRLDTGSITPGSAAECLNEEFAV